MAGDYRYGGFSNEELANYLGISVPEVQMFQQFIEGTERPTPETLAQMQLFASQSGGGPMGGANRLENIAKGIENLQQHPLGSKYHGFNPTGLLANFATGGLYGGYQALKGGDPMQLGAAGASPLSPGGTAQINTELRGPTSTLIGAGGTLAGAGLAGAFSGPAVGPEGIPYLTDASGFAGQQVLVDPVTGAAMPGAGLTPAQLTSLAGGGAGASGGFGDLGSVAGGMFAAQTLGGMLTPRGSEGTPMPGQAMPGAPGTPQQPRVGGAPSGSELDTPGAGYIDPAYIKRQKGGGNSRGIANQGDLSQQDRDARMAALYGFTGGM